MLRKTPLWAGQAFGSSVKDLARAGQSPHVLLDSLRFLAARGLTTPNLFSSEVNKRQLLALKEAYDSGRRALRSARVAANLEPSAAANLLLLWLGALPEALFPAEHVPELLQMQSKPGLTREECIASMRSLLKRTEPFIVEALFPLFELLHHYWINQPNREETLTELAAIFATPVFGTITEHNAPPEAAAFLRESAKVLISEYRPLFTQPYNLQRYQADLARQATAAEAKLAAVEAKKAQDMQNVLSPLRIHNGASPREHQEGGSSPPNVWLEVGSPLLTPRRMGALSVMDGMETLIGCSPDDSSPIWATFATHTLNNTANEEMEAMLDGMLTSTVNAAFNNNNIAAVNSECISLADRGFSPLSIVDAGVMSDASVSPVDGFSRESSDSDAELPHAQSAVLVEAAKRLRAATAAAF